MNKQQIKEQLEAHHAEFRHLLGSFTETEYHTATIGKWSPGQQLDHICRSLKPLTLAFSLPKPVLQLFFGKANRPSLDYEALVAKYQAKLAAGGRASKRYVPGKTAWARKNALLQRLERMVSTLSSKLDNYDESQLDSFILPHPLLGKLTLREMLYFTIYHVQHHQNAVLKNLDKS